MHLQPEAGPGRDECSSSAVLLYPQIELVGTRQRRSQIVLVENDAEMVDPRQFPLARLNDDVDRPTLELREAQLEADCVELLPRDAWLVAAVVVPNSAVSRDQEKAELREVAGLDLAHLARHEAVVEELH